MYFLFNRTNLTVYLVYVFLVVKWLPALIHVVYISRNHLYDGMSSKVAANDGVKELFFLHRELFISVLSHWIPAPRNGCINVKQCVYKTLNVVSGRLGYLLMRRAGCKHQSPNKSHAGWILLHTTGTESLRQSKIY
jgi:hypothetical protein